MATGMISLIKRIWKRSFAKEEKNPVVIANYGWNLYNYILLLDISIRATITEQKSWNKFVNNLLPLSFDTTIVCKKKESEYEMTDGIIKDLRVVRVREN